MTCSFTKRSTPPLDNSAHIIGHLCIWMCKRSSTWVNVALYLCQWKKEAVRLSKRHHQYTINATGNSIENYNIMTLAPAVLQIFCSHVSKLYTWYHDPSSSGSPDILFTRLFFHIKRDSRKREIIRANIYRILPKGNQVIYTLDTFCMPNNMTLAQAGLQIFCSQGHLWVKCLSPKREIIQSNFDRILW